MLKKFFINPMINILYELSLCLIALLMIPKIIYQWAIQKKYRNSLLDRFGFRCSVVKSKSALIWVHAVSVGETKAVTPLARQIKNLFPEIQIVVSSVTETGHAEAKRSLPFADDHVYLPFDFSFMTSTLISKAAPDLVVLCESDFWFNFLRFAKKGGAGIALVNGKLSERSMHRFSQVSFFSKRLLDLFDVLCLQNTLYYTRFLQAKGPVEKMVVTGNLKLDEEYPQLSLEEIKQWQKKLGFDSNQLVLAIGSTHNPEEQIFITILKEVWKKEPLLRVILVPRHPERFKEVALLLEKEHVPYIRFSNIAHRNGQEKVILMDTMGMLRMCYQLSDIALVGGSFTSKVGGHNILEPCWYGKPVLFGPHMHTQVELVNLIKQYEAGVQVQESELKNYLESWIQNKEERESIGRKGLSLVQESRGSTERTMKALNVLLDRLKEGNKNKIK